MSSRQRDPMIPSTFRITRVHKETPDTFTMELFPVNGNGGFSYAAGQFNMLYVFGYGEIPISISGDPAIPEKLVHTTRAVGNVTKAMRTLKTGEIIGVRGPFGTHWPVEEAKGNDVVIIAGGIGLAPLRPAMYQILSNREHYGRVVLLYGARTPSDILFRRELESWRAQFDLEVHVSVDRAIGLWRGNVGVVTSLIPKAPFDPLNTVALICGPEVMMHFTLLALKKRGVANENIYLSMERNMKCAIGFCGHCQYGPTFICKDGPVFQYVQMMDLFGKREV